MEGKNGSNCKKMNQFGIEIKSNLIFHFFATRKTKFSSNFILIYLTYFYMKYSKIL